MKQFIISFLGLAMAASVSAQGNEAYFLSQPALTPDGKTVIFSFEGDLWRADVNSGQAFRLTAMQGYETSAKVSPDGKWIAFTGRQYGNPDVFVMPLNGGDIRQVTYHSSGDEVNSWGWDSRTIYFTSGRMGQPSGYKVNMNGGTPERVFGNYFFLYDHNLFEHPTSGEIFFNDTWESSNQSARKRYKGAFNPDIQSYNIKTRSHKKYTDWEGKDFNASVDQKGNIYFISDEANGEYNLYTIADGKKTALTKFNTSIKSPMVSANGDKVVFERDYQLWIYDVANKKADKLNVSIFRNSILSKEKDFEVKGNITNYDISPDGKKMVFTSRGEIFVSDVEGKFVQHLDKGSAERAREVKWLSDNKTILYNQTKDGFLNWFTISVNGQSVPKQVTSDQKNNRYVSLNKKRTMAVYLSGRDEVKLIDLKTMNNRTLVKEEIWGFQNSYPGFSPNDDYVLFTAYRNFEQDVFIHNLKEKKTINLTNTGITESDPIWSPDGKFIYFGSSRLKPAYPFGMQDPKVYRLALEKMDEPFRTDKFNELFKDTKPADTTRKDSTKKMIPPVNQAAALEIDMENIMERMERVSPPFGSQYLQYVHGKGDKTTAFYTSNHGEGRFALWKTVVEPFESNKTDKIAGTDNSFGFDIVDVNDQFYVLMAGNIHKINLALNKVDPVNISYTFRRNLQDEFSQMFEEAWAQVQENYYDENFHGIDWKKMKQKYSAFIPYLNNRNDLRVVLNDMLGELNSSHQGFFSFGTDESVSLQNVTMETGIIFSNNDPYKVESIVDRSNADKKGIGIKAGDVLVKVNDRQVDKNMDRNYYFTRPSIDREIKLTFARGGQNFDVKLHPQATLYNNLYDQWIDDNQKRVDDKSKNRIAYAHMKNMGQGELESFLIDMTRELNSKDALILDLRYNTGGNVHDEVLKFLSQRAYLQWKYREGSLTTQSNFAPSDKPIVLLINEQSLSDAEMTAQGFKQLKLGKIIGNETYRWIIFTSGASLVDGSGVRLPGWGCYSLDGKDLEITGVAPDIKVVNTFQDKLTGKDPQLDRAIEEILKELK
ncbi:MAG TPA: S41 family peptidase [Flavisolibacter sp.]